MRVWAETLALTLKGDGGGVLLSRATKRRLLFCAKGKNSASPANYSHMLNPGENCQLAGKKKEAFSNEAAAFALRGKRGSCQVSGKGRSGGGGLTQKGKGFALEKTANRLLGRQAVASFPKTTRRKKGEVYLEGGRLFGQGAERTRWRPQDTKSGSLLAEKATLRNQPAVAPRLEKKEKREKDSH